MGMVIRTVEMAGRHDRTDKMYWVNKLIDPSERLRGKTFCYVGLFNVEMSLMRLNAEYYAMTCYAALQCYPLWPDPTQTERPA